MKKLGLIGGTGPESTLFYYHELVYGVSERMGGSFFPPLTIENLNIFKMLGFCQRQEYDGLADYLLGGIRSLAAAGADFAAFTGITPHLAYDRVMARSPIPILSMVDTALAYTVDKGYHKVGLLGTLPTMTDPGIRKGFAEKGIGLVAPTASEMAYLEEKIEMELVFDIVKDETAAGVAQIARRMAREDGIEAVVLGCTELPRLLVKQDLSVPVLDAMHIHIDALVDKIVEGEE
ncbi:MAG: amino acid racemase [Succiniclasticum sp.]|nr:amino acid racemase [Succiniclasticum sp.]MEE3480153.1 amino acid racemase [Succiniclasticum sp.]